ncbi:MAG: hypothetical protein BJ554DRAFT_5616, partial [Olpidium bornovanus]
MTFETFGDLADVEEAGVKMIRHVELWDPGHADVKPWGRPWFAHFVPKVNTAFCASPLFFCSVCSTHLDGLTKWRELGKDELPSGCESGVEYQTGERRSGFALDLNPPEADRLVINTKTYLRFLLSAFHSAGGSTRTQVLEDIAEAFEDDVDVVVNCTGIGAQRLGGVADQN